RGATIGLQPRGHDELLPASLRGRAVHVQPGVAAGEERVGDLGARHTHRPSSEAVGLCGCLRLRGAGVR
ncbi:unnamed protein product, partial [Symbiodinium sp. CCMP2456]